MSSKHFTVLLSLLCVLALQAQNFSPMDAMNGFGMDGNSQPSNNSFNRLNNDTTPEKEIPIGIYAWTIDRKFGDIKPTTVDTLPHLYPNSTLNKGVYGEYNTTGNNYTARLNRIVIDRPLTEQFMFTQPYSFVMKHPDEVHFTNTLSPYTNVSYDNCGDKQNGEDHIDAWFAINAGKRLGLGFDLNYAYARGYYSNQSASHFGATFFGSYLGDRYQMHAMLSTYHQKVNENGGIADDNYITHPESFNDNYAENEIPTILQQNWNRNNNFHFFLTHRYNFGFYRWVKLTEEEIKAREFAAASKKENEAKNDEDKEEDNTRRKRELPVTPPLGRPDNAKIVGEEPVIKDTLTTDTSRILVANDAVADSLLREEARLDSIQKTMKREYVPVTSIIHTLDFNRYDRIYQAYFTPDDYYANTYYHTLSDGGYPGDSIYDQTKMTSVKNTLAIALLEGFNKYAKAGLKVFASHELRKFDMPQLFGADALPSSILNRWNEHTVSVGGQMIKTQGRTLHYSLMAETWLAGEDLGQLKIDFNTDLNFPLFGDTITLAAKAYFYRLHPTFYQRNYHSKHLWWDKSGLSEETRTRIEGLFSYRKTKTTLRVAVEELQNYTYFGTSYTIDGEKRKNMTAGVRQNKSNINLLTAQLTQQFRLGILNWENVITYQNSSNKTVLPVPDFNVFTNLYLKFRIAKVLLCELGASATYFTEYEAPEFCPQLNQYAVQENNASLTKIGNYPIVDAYANLHLKHARFFLMFSHANAGNGNKRYFLTPHYPLNGNVMHIGVSWNFFN